MYEKPLSRPVPVANSVSFDPSSYAPTILAAWNEYEVTCPPFLTSCGSNTSRIGVSSMATNEPVNATEHRLISEPNNSDPICIR